MSEGDWCNEEKACALHCAVSLYTGLRAEQTPDDAKNVIEIAKVFEQYLTGESDGEEKEDGQ